jgi:hypothetical protein
MADEQNTDAAVTADTTANDAGKTFTQADVDKIIADRLAREQRKAAQTVEETVAQRLADELQRRELSESERLKLEKDEATKQAADVMARANARLLAAEAKAQALAAGVNPQYVDDVLALAKVTGDAFLTDGEPNADAIKTAVTAVLDTRPFYKAGAQSANFGGEFGGGKGAITQRDQLLAGIKEANTAGDFPRSIALSDQLAALQHAATQ